jgi:oligopeptide/dipeptide ABC transporter ATP-binding protein
VAEAGDVERVVKTPQHPYTQLLVASIPQVSTERSWLNDPQVAQLEQVPAGSCKFVARCPVSMPVCQQAAPPLFRTETRRVVACHHYVDSGGVPPDALASVFARS